ncbi:hypothetical protein DICPUDRAFT_81556 [Dictyostelium purpureum]|uniref:Transmembrane protein n=1 Tax=Dictyostelium purpureum TaxID=5786 RepID=F0ZTV1_DICPU|nr:uncharacterized protein DICPUDRAFT_81556 [Dictyostelium purpureum]EGC32624.1 hypothetical protein DICPUDRAFT_81556 [Dictyostelium purpureum]|eukprot:XP_003290839.1 hypothetical protein DICPUDRAFT_81556 [Dictyostelium purpureum]
MSTIFNFTSSKSPPYNSYNNNNNNNNNNDSMFRYNQGNEITSILFLSLISVFVFILSITLLNFIKSLLLYNELNEFKYKIKKYFLKYIEKIFFCFGILVMLWYIAESLNLINLVESIFDENILTSKIKINNNNGELINKQVDEIIIATTTTKTTKVSKFENDYISIETKLNKNKFLNLSVQIIITLFIYYFQTLYYWIFQLIILNKTSLSDKHTNNTNKLFNIITPLNLIINHYNKSFSIINDKNYSLSNSNNNNNKNNPNNIKKYIFKFQNEYIEPMVERMLDLPWITILLILLISWLSIRMYLENVPIHSLSGKWSLENILESITYCTIGCFISSLIIFLYSILFLNYNNKVLKDSIKITSSKDSSNKDDNGSKKPNKKKKQVSSPNNNNNNNNSKTTSPILNNSDDEKETIDKINATHNNKNEQKEDSEEKEESISFDFAGLIYILKIITLVCAIIGIILVNIGLNNINSQQLLARTTIFSTSELSNTNNNYDSSFVPTVVTNLDENQNIITNLSPSSQKIEDLPQILEPQILEPLSIPLFQFQQQQQDPQQNQQEDSRENIQDEQKEDKFEEIHSQTEASPGQPQSEQPQYDQQKEEKEEKENVSGKENEKEEKEEKEQTKNEQRSEAVEPQEISFEQYQQQEYQNMQNDNSNIKQLNHEDLEKDNEIEFSDDTIDQEEESLEEKRKSFSKFLESIDPEELDIIESDLKDSFKKMHKDSIEQIKQNPEKQEQQQPQSPQQHEKSKPQHNLEELKPTQGDKMESISKESSIITENIPRSLNVNNHEIFQNNNTINSNNTTKKTATNNNSSNQGDLDIYNFLVSMVNRTTKSFYGCFNNSYRNGNMVLINIILLSIIIFILNPMSLTVLPLLAHLSNINNLCGDYSEPFNSNNDNNNRQNNIKKKEDIVNLISPIKND